MKIPFHKYQGTGNDFVMIDDRSNSVDLSSEQIEKVCHRNFGVGADGLILLRGDKISGFEMIYYNSDGHLSSMCGNGGRCFVRFLSDLGLIENKVEFEAIDGLHSGEVLSDSIKLKMNDVEEIKIEENYVFLDTGSPHHIEFVEDLEDLDINKKGAEIRYSDLYSPGGTNVNFVQIEDGKVKMRTYERGVENETLSCGTGVTAVAIAVNALKKINQISIDIHTKGGKLNVSFTENNKIYSDIYLSGAANKVFDGEIELIK